MLWLLLWKKLTRWVMSVKVMLDDEEVRWWWYETRARACESAWCMCDTHGKFQLSGISGDLFPVTSPPPRCLMVGTFHVYYTCISHFRTPFLLSLTITSSSSSITLTLITLLVSFFHSNSHSISTIDYRMMNKWLSHESEINKKAESFCAYAACRRQAIAIDDR